MVLTPLMLTFDEQFPLRVLLMLAVTHVEMVVALESHLGRVESRYFWTEMQHWQGLRRVLVLLQLHRESTGKLISLILKMFL